MQPNASNKRQLLETDQTINALVNRIDSVLDKCNANSSGKQNSKTTTDVDDFARIVGEVHSKVEDTKEVIQARTILQQERGCSMETIRKGAIIRENLNQLESDCLKLSHILRNQALHAKKDDETLEQRQRTLHVLRQNINELKRMSSSPNESDNYRSGLSSNLKTFMTTESVEQNFIQATQEDVELLEKWKRRDKGFDDQLDKIGGAIDRITDAAETIGQKLDHQGQLVNQLNVQTDEASDQMKNVHNKVKSVIQKQSKVSFCFKLILCILVITMFAIVATTGITKFS